MSLFSRLWTPPKQKFKRVIIVGTRKAGKTVALGCMDLAATIKSQTNKRFKCFIDEKTSGMCQVSSDLCRGYFPDETPPGFIYKADVYLVEEPRTPLGEQRGVKLPVCETAGEDMEKLIGPYAQEQYRKSDQLDLQNIQNLNQYICDSNGFILVGSVNRPYIPDVPSEFLESEPLSLRWDPDLNLRRILASIIRYKQETRSPKIEGIAVLLTKYDTIVDYLKIPGKNMDLYTEAGARNFVETYFRQTASVLKFYGMEKVRFFPVHVSVEKVRGPDGIVRFARHSDGRGYKIELDERRNLPMFSEQVYLNLIDWIMDTFA